MEGVGTGIPKSDYEDSVGFQVPEEKVEEIKNEVVRPNKNSELWSKTPCIKDQTIKHPDTVAWDGGIKVRSFILPNDEDKLNELYSNIDVTDPKLEIIDEIYEPVKETLQWMVVIKYAELKFKKVITNGNE
jgi:hypothetical protein